MLYIDEELNIHSVLGIPENRVSVEISSWVKPQIELLLSVSFALCEKVSMNYVRIAAEVSQEFKV